jgi:hypothetical protein
MGQTGIDKKRHLELLRNLSSARGKSIDALYSIGDIMYEESQKAGKPIRQGKILDLPLAELAVLRRSAFNRIGNESAGMGTVFLSSHAVFRWNNQLFRAFELADFEAFKPDLIITLVDDVEAVKLQLDELGESGELPADTAYSLKDLLVWREEEILASEILASVLGVPHYVLGVWMDPQVTTVPLEVAYSLMFEPWKRKAYISYPISDAQSKPEIWDKVLRFRRLGMSYLCAFDPLMINEKRLYRVLQRHRDENPTATQMYLPTRGKEVLLDLPEIDGIIPDIDGQIVARDYKLIDQAEMIVAYVPLDTDGSPLIAGGVQSELEHAAASTREVVVVWESAKEPTPFIHQRADKRFATLEALEEYLREISQPTGQLEMPIESESL